MPSHEIKKKVSVLNEKEAKEIEALQHIKTNPKAFFTYAKKHSKVSTDVGPLRDSEGKIHSDAREKAKILQEQYTKVFSDPQKVATDDIKGQSTDKTIADIYFTTEDVEEAIQDIPTFAAPGPDKFPAILLKECCKQLAYPLYKIWRKSLDEGKIPAKLKSQSIIPIYKRKGGKASAANYRPVSLTSHVIKLMERVMRKALVKFIEETDALTEFQFAFREGRSTVSQLLQHIDNILTILEEDANADVVYLDFAKAFDKVDHKRLLKKLKSLGITGKVYNWLEDFLQKRTQKVVVEGQVSDSAPVISGVPQGTVLGPVLFIVFINDLTEVIKHSQLLIFADDSKITKKIETLEDHKKLQEDIHSAITWSMVNNMELNMDKFQLVQSGEHPELKIEYKINSDNSIKNSDVVKDLGIHVTPTLSWDYQITKMINDSKKMSNWILRTFTTRNSEILLYLYKTFVIPKLEYGSQVWTPYMIKDIGRIEAVQRSYTARLDEMSNFNYHERLQALNLYSLQRRRERFLIITMWKISVGLVPNTMNIVFYRTSRFGMKARRKCSKAKRLHLRTIRFNYFTSTGPALYNLLPRKLKRKTTLDTFKKNLDKYIKQFPDRPPCPGYQCANNNSLLSWAACRGDYNNMEAAGDSEDGEADDPDLAID